jgi:5-methylcytosine-specific restriction endonuclease McrA
MPRNRRKILQHREAAFRRQGGRCYYCGQPMWLNDVENYCAQYAVSPTCASWLQCTAEHLVACRDGGKDEADNIVAACLFCNRRRHARPQPLEPERYKAHVRGRVLRGRWHGAAVFAMLSYPRSR